MKFKSKKSFKFLNMALAVSLLLSGNALAADTSVNETSGSVAVSSQAFVAGILSPFSSALQADEKALAEKEAKEAEQARAAAAAEQAAKEEAAKKAAAEQAAKEQAQQSASATVNKPAVYTPSYGSSVSYSSSKKATDALKANATCRGTYKITFYCSCSKCCGKSDGITASGTRVKEGRTVAVSRSKFNLGSKIFIEGLGDFIAEDTGVFGYKIDVFVNSHAKAYQMGVRYCTVYQLKS